MKKLRRASILGATVLCSALFDQPVMAVTSVNDELCKPADRKDCYMIYLKVRSDRLRIRRTRVTCRKPVNYLKSIVVNRNINEKDTLHVYIKSDTCPEYKVEVKGSWGSKGNWRDCDHWKKTSDDDWITTPAPTDKIEFIPLYTLGQTKTGGACYSLYLLEH